MADSKNNVPMYLFQAVLTLLFLVVSTLGGIILSDIKADVKASAQSNIKQDSAILQLNGAMTTVQEDTEWQRKSAVTDKKHWTILSWTKTRINDQRFKDGLPPLDWPDMTGITVED